MEQIDVEIIKGLLAGDHRAYGMLIRLYFQPLTLYAKSILNDFEQSKDIVQEVFLKLWNNRDNLNVSTSLKSYVYQMVHHTCIDFLRKGKTRESIHAVSYDDLRFRMQIFEIKEEDHFFDIMFSEEMDQMLQQAIDQLPPQCKEIFLLSRYEQLTYPEISEKLSVSLSTVKTQMVRAMQKLKEELKIFLK